MLWSTAPSYAVELRHRFHADITSVALHPSGLHLLVGLTDVVKWMSVHDRALSEFKSFPVRACTTCCFSPGGQFFALMHATTILIYDSYTTELLGHLRGHTSRIRRLRFAAHDDTRLLSTGHDGAVYEFSLADFHKVGECLASTLSAACSTRTSTTTHPNTTSTNNTQLAAVSVTKMEDAVADVHTVWAAGSDGRLRQLQRPTLSPVAVYETGDSALTALALSTSLKLLLGGGEDGSLRVYNTYLGEKMHASHKDDTHTTHNHTTTTMNSSSTTSVVTQAPCLKEERILMELHGTHVDAVTAIAIAADDGLVLSVGEDGLLVVYDVVAPHRRGGGHTHTSFSAATTTAHVPPHRRVHSTGNTNRHDAADGGGGADYETELLMDRRDVERTAALLHTLQTQIRQLRRRMRQQRVDAERAHEARMVAVEKDFADAAARQRGDTAALQSAMNAEAVALAEAVAELTRRSAAMAAQTHADYTAQCDALRDRARQWRARAAAESATRARQLAQREHMWASQAAQSAARVAAQCAALDAVHTDAQTATRMAEEAGLAAARRVEAAHTATRVARQTAAQEALAASAAGCARVERAAGAAAARAHSAQRVARALDAAVAAAQRRQAATESAVWATRAGAAAAAAESRDAAADAVAGAAAVEAGRRHNAAAALRVSVLTSEAEAAAAAAAPTMREVSECSKEWQSVSKETAATRRVAAEWRREGERVRAMRRVQQKEWRRVAAVESRAAEAQRRLADAVAACFRVRHDAPALRRAAERVYAAYAHGGGGGGGRVASEELASYETSDWGESAPSRRSQNTTLSSSATAAAAAAAASPTKKRTTIAVSAPVSETGVVREYTRRRDHLDHNLASLREKVVRDAENRRAEGNRIMTENVVLVQDINALRRDARALAARRTAAVRKEGGGAGMSSAMVGVESGAEEEEWVREMCMQRVEMERLSSRVTALEEELASYGVVLPESGAEGAPTV